MLRQGTLFDEVCFETRRQQSEQNRLSRYIKILEKVKSKIHKAAKGKKYKRKLNWLEN